MPTLQQLNPKPGDIVRRKYALHSHTGWEIIDSPEGVYKGRKDTYSPDHPGILLAAAYDDWEFVKEETFFGLKLRQFSSDDLDKLGRAVADELVSRVKRQGV